MGSQTEEELALTNAGLRDDKTVTCRRDGLWWLGVVTKPMKVSVDKVVRQKCVVVRALKELQEIITDSDLLSKTLGLENSCHSFKFTFA